MVDTYDIFKTMDLLKDYKPELFHLRNYFYNVELISDNRKLEFNPVIAEDKNCLTTLLAFGLRETSIIIEGLSGSGKTRIVESIKNLLPSSSVLELRMGSEKSTWYQAEKINAAKFIIIPELQKATGDIQEILKDWGEGRNSTYDVTDVTMDKNGDQVRDKILDAKPFLTSRALENPDADVGAELSRRTIRLRTNSSINQTKKILKYKLDLKSKPTDTLRTMSNEDINLLRLHIEDCINLPDYEIKNPCAPALEKYIPSLFRISSSHIEYFFCVVDAITKFYYKDRIKYYYKNKEGEESIILLSTPSDIFYAWVIYGQEFVELCLEMPELGRPILSVFPAITKKIDATYSTSREESLSIKELIQAVRQKAGVMLKRGDAQKQVMKLLFTGYLEEHESDEKEKTKRFCRTKLANLILNENPLDWELLIETCKRNVKEIYPEVAEEYIEKFCGDEIIAMHPLTGNEVNIYDNGVAERGEIKEIKMDESEESANLQIIENLLAGDN